MIPFPHTISPDEETLGAEFENAVRFLARRMPPAEQMARKPALFHGIRVGVYLYGRKYSQDVVLAGVLHDAVEFAGVDARRIAEEFGERVAELVLASTKDDSIEDPEAKTDELIRRCVSCGEDALIVKTADILDSFSWYTRTGNMDQLAYCTRNANAIMKHKPDDFRDEIFDELGQWLRR